MSRLLFSSQVDLSSNTSVLFEDKYVMRSCMQHAIKHMLFIFHILQARILYSTMKC